MTRDTIVNGIAVLVVVVLTYSLIVCSDGFSIRIPTLGHGAAACALTGLFLQLLAMVMHRIAVQVSLTRSAQSRCLSCGYALIHPSAICPECGIQRSSFTASASSIARWRSTRLYLLGLTLNGVSLVLFTVSLIVPFEYTRFVASNHSSVTLFESRDSSPDERCTLILEVTERVRHRTFSGILELPTNRINRRCDVGIVGNSKLASDIDVTATQDSDGTWRLLDDSRGTVHSRITRLLPAGHDDAAMQGEVRDDWESLIPYLIDTMSIPALSDTTQAYEWRLTRPSAYLLVTIGLCSFALYAGLYRQLR